MKILAFVALLVSVAWCDSTVQNHNESVKDQGIGSEDTSMTHMKGHNAGLVDSIMHPSGNATSTFRRKLAGGCSENPFALFRAKVFKVRTCSWLRRKKKRQTKYCRVARKICRSTCNNCPKPPPRPTPRPNPRPNPRPSPTGPPTSCQGIVGCSQRKTIPDVCEVKILMEMLEMAVSKKRKLPAQFLRMAFHDAGTFNQDTGEGGVNGCLLNDDRMQVQEENLFLGLPIFALEKIKKDWLESDQTCISVSSADMIQFAGLYVSVRQTGNPGMTSAKERQILDFQWGRPDESNCDPRWARNLPTFDLGTNRRNIPLRCLNAGREIKRKVS